MLKAPLLADFTHVRLSPLRAAAEQQRDEAHKRKAEEGGN
jgi:hypothetical protein